MAAFSVPVSWGRRPAWAESAEADPTVREDRSCGMTNHDTDTGSRQAKAPAIALATLWIPPIVCIVLFVADHL
jgi:hypothetical protein